MHKSLGVWIQWNGMVDWNGGMEWNGGLEWNGGMEQYFQLVVTSL